MKELPVGLQDFRQIIEGNYLYVDKTEAIHKLIKKGKFYFLSRPRRFGKSLLLFTLKEIFLGNKKLFKNLWIYDKIDWKPRPVIHLSFVDFPKSQLSLDGYIHQCLEEISKEYGIVSQEKDVSTRFGNLIKTLGKIEQVVVLIDEYDKPIMDYLDDLPVAQNHRDTLQSFFAKIKGNSRFIHFVFVTGIVKLPQVSIFSTLNNLNDITLNDTYSDLVGITYEELLTYFTPYLAKVQQKLGWSQDELLQQIRFWYNGYSWDGKTFVYNPFSLLKFFDGGRFGNFWYATGTPYFLIKAMREQSFPIIELEGLEMWEEQLSGLSLEQVDTYALLFQTGYLTIKETVNYYGHDEFVVSYPNEEVRRSLDYGLLQEYTHNPNLVPKLSYLRRTLENKQLPKFIRHLQALFASIPYHLLKHALSQQSFFNPTAWEAHYHLVIYLTLRSLGMNVKCEVPMNQGRIDAVIETRKYIYVMEFKLGDAKKGIEQIKANKYHTPYLDKEKELILLGIGFDNEQRNIHDWVSEVLAD